MNRAPHDNVCVATVRVARNYFFFAFGFAPLFVVFFETGFFVAMRILLSLGLEILSRERR